MNRKRPWTEDREANFRMLPFDVDFRSEYYLQQRDQALKQAENDILDKDGWLRIATKWQKLHDRLAAQLGGGTIGKAHVLDS